MLLMMKRSRMAAVGAQRHAAAQMQLLPLLMLLRPCRCYQYPCTWPPCTVPAAPSQPPPQPASFSLPPPHGTSPAAPLAACACSRRRTGMCQAGRWHEIGSRRTAAAAVTVEGAEVMVQLVKTTKVMTAHWAVVMAIPTFQYDSRSTHSPPPSSCSSPLAPRCRGTPARSNPRRLRGWSAGARGGWTAGWPAVAVMTTFAVVTVMRK